MRPCAANPSQSGVVRTLWDTIDMADALHPQTQLAYAMNEEPLPADHGAPVRLRLGRHLGYKNTKYLSQIIVTDRRESFNPANGSSGVKASISTTVEARPRISEY